MDKTSQRQFWRKPDTPMTAPDSPMYVEKLILSTECNVDIRTVTVYSSILLGRAKAQRKRRWKS